MPKSKETTPTDPWAAVDSCVIDDPAIPPHARTVAMCMAEWKLGRKTTENILNQKCSNGILRRAKRRGVCGGGKMGMLTYYWPVNHDDNQST